MLIDTDRTRPFFFYTRVSVHHRRNAESVSAARESSGDQGTERGDVTGQEEGEARPAGRDPAAVPRRDAYAYHRVIVISARWGTQRSAPSDEGSAIDLVRV